MLKTPFLVDIHNTLCTVSKYVYMLLLYPGKIESANTTTFLAAKVLLPLMYM